MSNGANYQHSGTENLRANETDMYSPIITVPTSGTDRNAATKQMSGTEDLRSQTQDKHVPIASGKASGSPFGHPSTVDSFKDNTV